MISTNRLQTSYTACIRVRSTRDRSKATETTLYFLMIIFEELGFDAHATEVYPGMFGAYEFGNWVNKLIEKL